MDILDLDPGTMLVAGLGAAVIGSPEARRSVSRGAGWVAATAWRVTRPVVMPLVDAGRDMAGEVRDSASQHNGHTGAGETTGARPAARGRRTAATPA
jgi:hypothetical protein